MTDQTDLEDFYDAYGHLWRPVEAHGWTWVQTMNYAPELHSLFDGDGELMGEVYQRFNRVICWAPFTWAEEAYRSEEDVGEYGFETAGQRLRHFTRIAESLRGWAARKRAEGVDIALLRDTHAYYFETGNGHFPITPAEFNRRDPWPHPDPPPSIGVDGWQAERAFGWHCEGWAAARPVRADARKRAGPARRRARGRRPSQGRGRGGSAARRGTQPAQGHLPRADRPAGAPAPHGVGVRGRRAGGLAAPGRGGRPRHPGPRPLMAARGRWGPGGRRGQQMFPASRRK